VVGYDDIEFSRCATPALTTVKQSKRDMARAALQLLTLRIGAGPLEPQTRFLPVSPEVRESCGRTAAEGR